MSTSSEDPTLRRGRVKKTKPGPNGRMAKTKKRARPVLGLITLYHGVTGEARDFYPVDAELLISAGTYCEQSPLEPVVSELEESAPPKRGRPPKNSGGIPVDTAVAAPEPPPQPHVS